MTELTPPDYLQCQSEIVVYQPFVMGGPTRQWVRCGNAAMLIVTEVDPGSDGLKGSMSLCAGCYEKFLELHPSKRITVAPVSPS